MHANVKNGERKVVKIEILSDIVFFFCFCMIESEYTRSTDLK